MDEDVSVRVAVRIRPQIPREVIEMCRICTQVTPGEPQVVLGADKAFTYDFVFDTSSVQETIYEDCVASLINGALEGYNATVLAYGQTGSGKTYTMGTGFDVDLPDEQLGIIPRAISHMFNGIEERVSRAQENNAIPPKFKITAQFLELYNEEIIDLFNPMKESYVKNKGYKINEDPTGAIHIKGVTVKPVTSIDDAIQYLKLGALSRTTASTQMNSQSSRSHAIFTLHIIQERIVPADSNDDCSTEPANEFETLSAKFHFVDLAGSERLKRTGATGERAKEGISINCGLLALGNVISALGDKSKKSLHVPYRDSKLTRLLQDSLGGNSQTVMIACISPSDRDFMETLNTLKYANRARNIKNRIVINQDKSSRTINVLRQQIAQLQLELLEYKQGKRVIEEDGTETINDMFYENNMLHSELNTLKTRVKAMQETIDVLRERNTSLLAERETGKWLNDGNTNVPVADMIKGYLSEIEDLGAKLTESNHVCEELRKALRKTQEISRSSNATSGEVPNADINTILEEAKKEIQREKELLEKNKKQEDDEYNSDSSEKETESDEETDSEEKIDDGLQAELENLTTDIDMKQKLIQELELSQHRLNTMRQHYEEKLLQLQTRIRDTQDERDKVLQSFVGQPTKPTEEVLKVRQSYERKLQDMQKELKRLQSAQKEHARLLRNQTQHESRLRSLNNELMDMKRAKVKLLNTMKEESTRHKKAEEKRIREIAQLRKESRRNANVIRSMVAEKRAKEQVLRRKQEEVSALRREKQNRLSSKAAGRVGQKYSVKAVKQKWMNVEKMINKFSMIKQGLVEQEARMEQLLEKRDTLGKDLDRFQAKRAALLASKQDTTEVDNLIEDLKANINYVQDTITETQHSVMEIEESQETAESSDIAQSITDINEARYMIQKLFNMTVNQGYVVAQRDAKLKENEATLNEMRQEVYVRSQLLDHMLHTDEEGFAKSMITSHSSNANETDPDCSSNTSSRSCSPVDNEMSTAQRTKAKIRRQTAQPQELLFGKPKKDECDNNTPTQEQTGKQQDDNSMTKVPSAPGSLKGLAIARTHSTIETPVHNKVTTSSPRAVHRIPLHQSTKYGSMEQGLDRETSSPLTSPLVYRRQFSRDDNVFSRLTSSTVQGEPQTTTGQIITYTGKQQGRPALQCMYVAQGHSNGVLSICATDELFFTGAADRTVKIWDLQKGAERQTLTGHANNVVAVRYLPSSHMLLSASSAFVKVWDIRTSDARCVKVLCSSGINQLGSSTLLAASGNRGAPMPVGESPINDLVFNTSGTVLCTASYGKVILWDLRKFAPIGKLITGHQAAVMCLACDKLDATTDVIVTGSKDHYIKTFNIGPITSGSISPSMNLNPPHYDGIQSLAIGQNTLFSGSRDMCIKKWDLNKAELIQSINNAHKGWICGLTMLKDNKVLMSGCRTGLIKLWNADTCDQLAEIKGHSNGINAITKNSTHVFTASNTGDVKVWKLGDV